MLPRCSGVYTDHLKVITLTEGSRSATTADIDIGTALPTARRKAANRHLSCSRRRRAPIQYLHALHRNTTTLTIEPASRLSCLSTILAVVFRPRQHANPTTHHAC